MPDELSVRQWQEQFRAGAFNAQDRYTQCAAGWYDWFCQDHALAGRLKKIGRVVMGITDPFILDNYYVWFKNNCPCSGPLYDDARFEPLNGERDEKYFVISLDSPHERMKWALITERFGFDTPEFECRNVRDMVKYINELGPQLEQNIIPAFIPEKKAVEAYIQGYGEPAGTPVYLEGTHRYSYKSRLDRRLHIVMASADLKDVPSGFDLKRAKNINGIHIYCPDRGEQALPGPVQQPQQHPVRKEAER